MADGKGTKPNQIYNMKTMSIQYSLPCEKPEENVVSNIRRGVIHIEIPMNYPDVHTLTLDQILKVAKAVDATSVELVHKVNKKIPFPSEKKYDKVREQP